MVFVLLKKMLQHPDPNALIRMVDFPDYFSRRWKLGSVWSWVAADNSPQPQHHCFNELYGSWGCGGALHAAANEQENEGELLPANQMPSSAAARRTGSSTSPVASVTSARLVSEAKFPLWFSCSWSGEWCFRRCREACGWLSSLPRT